MPQKWQSSSCLGVGAAGELGVRPVASPVPAGQHPRWKQTGFRHLLWSLPAIFLQHSWAILNYSKDHLKFTGNQPTWYATWNAGRQGWQSSNLALQRPKLRHGWNVFFLFFHHLGYKKPLCRLGLGRHHLDSGLKWLLETRHIKSRCLCKIWKTLTYSNSKRSYICEL